MPWLVVAATVGLALYFRSKSPPLDAALTPDQLTAIRWALKHETNMVALEEFSHQLALANRPLAAAVLHARVIRGK